MYTFIHANILDTLINIIQNDSLKSFLYLKKPHKTFENVKSHGSILEGMEIYGSIQYLVLILVRSSS